jgi:hypothetical protein
MQTLESFHCKLAKFQAETDRPFNISGHPKVRIHEHNAPEALSFCEERFGNDWIWSNPTHTDWAEIFFLRTEDALVFGLTFEQYR